MNQRKRPGARAVLDLRFDVEDFEHSLRADQGVLHVRQHVANGIDGILKLAHVGHDDQESPNGEASLENMIGAKQQYCAAVDAGEKPQREREDTLLKVQVNTRPYRSPALIDCLFMLAVFLSKRFHNPQTRQRFLHETLGFALHDLYALGLLVEQSAVESHRDVLQGHNSECQQRYLPVQPDHDPQHADESHERSEDVAEVTPYHRAHERCVTVYPVDRIAHRGLVVVLEGQTQKMVEQISGEP